MIMHFLIIGGYCEITATFLQEKVPIFTRKVGHRKGEHL